MPRPVAVALLILLGFAWLMAGLLVAALVMGALGAGMSGDDPRVATIGVAALLIWVAVALIGFSTTYGMLRRRMAEADSSPSRRASRAGGTTSAPAPNTLRGDAVMRPPSLRRGPMSPVPPAPRPGTAPAPFRRSSAAAAPSAPPAQRPSTADASAWGWTAASRATSRAATRRPPAPIPGAQTVSSQAPGRGQAASAGVTASQWEAAPRRDLRLPEALAVIAGVLVLGAVDQMTGGAWLLPVLLLFASGAIAAGSRSGPVSAPLRGAILAVAPSAIAAVVAAANGTVDLQSTLQLLLFLFVAAWMAITLGMAGGRIVGGLRG